MCERFLSVSNTEIQNQNQILDGFPKLKTMSPDITEKSVETVGMVILLNISFCFVYC